MAATLAINSCWADKALYDDAEKRYYENLAKLQISGSAAAPSTENKPSKSKKSKHKNKNNTEVKEIITPTPAANQGSNESEKKEGKKKAKNQKTGNSVGGGGGSQPKTSLASEVAKAREHIKTSLEIVNGLTGKPAPAPASAPAQTPAPAQTETSCRSCTTNASALADAVALKEMIKSLEKRVAALEIKCAAPPCAQVKAPQAKPAPAPKKPAAKPDDDDDDVDLFGSESEEEDEEAKRLKEERVAAYAAKKSNKPTLIAKSSIILDVKPWDDETDMKQLEAAVRKIEMEGLLWGASKLVPLAYGIHKLQINCVVEDEKVSVDLLTEKIEDEEDLVQSVDIAAFNKI